MQSKSFFYLTFFCENSKAMYHGIGAPKKGMPNPMAPTWTSAEDSINSAEWLAARGLTWQEDVYARIRCCEEYSLQGRQKTKYTPPGEFLHYLPWKPTAMVGIAMPSQYPGEVHPVSTELAAEKDINVEWLDMSEKARRTTHLQPNPPLEEVTFESEMRSLQLTNNSAYRRYLEIHRHCPNHSDDEEAGYVPSKDV